MAILNDLIVRGATRCLNTLYANSLQTDSQTISGDLTVNGYTHMGYSTSRSDTKLSVAGITNNQWYRSSGAVGWYNDSYSGGIYMTDSTYVRTYNNKAFLAINGLYTGASAQYYLNSNGKLNAVDGVFSNNLNVGYSIVARNVSVTNTLRAAKYDLQTVTQMGTNGTLYVAPSIQFPTSNTTSVTAASTSITIIDTNITSDVMAGVVWRPSAKVKISGTINGVVTGTVDGTITSINTSSKTMVIGNLSGGNWSSVVAGTYTKDKIENLNIMMYETYQNSTYYPVGILLTSYGAVSEHTDGTAKTYIDIYGGSTTKPVVRLGNMTGLDAINGVTPSGWGLYTSNGYFSGLIVSSSGKIGGWSIGENSIYNNTNSMTSTAVGTFIGQVGFRNYKSNDAYVNIKDGIITAKGVNLTGTINATEGNIGGATITGGVLTVPAAKVSGELTAATINGSKITSGTITIGKLDTSAQTKINDASKTASNYIIADSTGLMIADVSDGEASSSTITKRNVFINNSSIVVRDGLKELAKFGSDGIIIGDVDNLNIKITNDRMLMYSKSTPTIQLITGDDTKSVANTALYVTFPFSTVTTKTYVVDSEKNNFFKYSTSVKALFDVTDGSDTTTERIGRSFTFGTSASKTMSYDTTSYNFSCSCTIEYDGAYTFIIKDWTYSNLKRVEFYIEYDLEEAAPNVILGTTTAKSFGAFSVTEGDGCQASGDNSHAEGEGSKAIGLTSHTEGVSTIARGGISHAEGYLSKANGYCSHAQNYATIADSSSQTAIGKFNISDSDNTYSFIIGNGTSGSYRSNALTVDWNGNVQMYLDTINVELDNSILTAIQSLGWEDDVID